ncbi:MAG: hypothetical protein EZS28_004751 [Streblomastix strix]|uniref:Uncharacterized protein n=1 Tax=Streblomastix strix TaxID=222440 RepID=A0A5J4WZU9_9EUKA|nr:MAG: hypothetical protein EZS28_004751 [Streblomastix strix]
MQLTDSDYIRVMAESIGSGGGDGEQLNSNIQYDLFKISRFFTDCQNGRMFPRPTFPQQTELFKNLSEQTEQEGGIEEVDSQMISAGFDKFGRNLRLRAKCAKEAISNYFCDQSNFE